MNTNERLVGDELQRRLWNAGFAACSTGGGFNAYAKVLADGKVLFICDNENQLDDISDDDFIISLQEEGSPLAEFVKVGDTLSYYDHTNAAEVVRENNGATIVAALSVFGVQI